MYDCPVASFKRHLSDLNKDNALNLDEFCIAMHLVVALRHGLELPSTLPSVLLPEKKEEGNVHFTCAELIRLTFNMGGQIIFFSTCTL